MQASSQSNYSSEPPRRPLVNLCGGAIALLTLVSPLLIIADSSSVPPRTPASDRIPSHSPTNPLMTQQR